MAKKYQDETLEEFREERYKKYQRKYKKEHKNDKRKKYELSVTAKKRKRIKLYKMKIQIIKEMGGKCVCCSITQWWILTFDHIKPLNTKIRKGSLIWNLFKHIELREDLQVMCFGCNVSKATNKKCRLDHSLN